MGEAEWKNYSIESKVRVNYWGHATTQAVGLIGRYQDDGNYYLFVYEAPGELRIKRKLNGELTTLKSKSFTLNMNHWYNFRTEMIGGTLRFYVDGRLELEVQDGEFASGKAGLISVYASSRFDDLRLLTLENPGTGRVLMEQWNGIPGKSLAALKSSRDYPSRPSSRVFLNKLETPQNSGDNYGRRIRGYLHVTQPGDYVFYIAGDDESQFFLSTTDKPEQLSNEPVAAISSSEWTSLTEWDKYPGQTSAPIHLEAGQRYYFEALNKEATGKDGVAVGWKLPDGQIQRPIPGRSLSPFEVDPAYTTPIPA
ncbi:MAG: PA14 domain-containing protein, partial [Pseudobdellovibrionaceae bacterium]|nr:PA14 domain-containing protein [Pseudobdellovibrionaceae bacterium]